MIPLVKSLESHRRRKGIIKRALMEHLGYSIAKMDNVCAEGYIDILDIPRWCRFIELPMEDYSSLVQYHNRERIYHKLSLTYDPDEYPLQEVTDLLFFRPATMSDIKTSITKAIIHNIFPLPHLVKIGLSE